MSKKIILLTASTIVLSLLIGTKIYKEHVRKTQDILLQHCLNINEDVTRSEETRCTNPLSFNGSIFRFTNKEGVIAQYEIVSTKADIYDLDDNVFYYNFVAYEEK